MLPRFAFSQAMFIDSTLISFTLLLSKFLMTEGSTLYPSVRRTILTFIGNFNLSILGRLAINNSNTKKFRLHVSLQYNNDNFIMFFTIFLLYSDIFCHNY